MNRLYNVSRQMAVIEDSLLTEGVINVDILPKGKHYLYHLKS